MARNIDKAALDASAAKAGEPALIPGQYPRAWPIEVYGREDGSCDFEFVLDGKWHRLPLTAADHAAAEVGTASRTYISPLNYAKSAAIFLTALRRNGWTVSPPTSEVHAGDSKSIP